MTETEKQIRIKAGEIAGALWGDVYCDVKHYGSLADCLIACAAHPNAGTDGDLTDEDRAALVALSKQCGVKPLKGVASHGI